jgi:hypothetical protein
LGWLKLWDVRLHLSCLLFRFGQSVERLPDDSRLADATLLGLPFELAGKLK